ncbi:hypothetical protein L6452_41552 [Arctium lappa]|uniref:Uncharacterized protein n=1 Tax=Arctium lappa TaxID=4217 RepID=A0ACB8XNK9_ARCLA|nr:hypothetical protein L6452_41552 [Arctium lappa]
MGSIHEFWYKNLSVLVSILSAYLISLFYYLVRFRRNCGFWENKFGEIYEEIELKRGLGEKDDDEFVEFLFKFSNFEGFDERKRDDESLVVGKNCFDEFVDELEGDGCGFSLRKDENPDGFDGDLEEKEARHEDSNEKVDEWKLNQESVYSYVNSHGDLITLNGICLSKSNVVDAYGGGDDDFVEKEGSHEEKLNDSNEKVDQKVDEQKFHQETLYSYVNKDSDSFTSSDIHSSTSDAYGDEDDDFEEKEAPHEEKFKDSNEKVDQKVDEQKFHQETLYSHVNKDSDSITSNNFHSSTSDAYGDEDDDFEEKEAPHEETLKDSNEKVDEQKFHQETVYSHVNKHSDSFTSNNIHSSTSDAYNDVNDLGRKSIDTKEPGGKTADSNTKNPSNDSRNKLESLMEHQELIEQLKMEIKKVKVIGLPTIFEESESPPKIMELQPWKKIEEAYQNVGHKLNEVHKFYKIYKEKMRKFDIFSYQKMYATGFLQLNDPFQSVSSSRSLVPEITTHLCRSFSSTKVKKRDKNPTRKFIKELQSDLEVVYVGQMCLSWEILHWQYEKVLEIWESDPRGVHQFHEVCGEFQRFVVLMQRFLEEEPFHGPRVHNYVKARCVFRNLLQVPVVREDNSKNRRKSRSQADGNGMSCDMLVEILEESIRLFWRFIRADKDTRKTPLEFQKPEDSRLFMKVQKDLHKKERKLKEQLRGGNCILKRLRWKEEDSNDQVLRFCCQVDLKLVARGLTYNESYAVKICKLCKA